MTDQMNYEDYIRHLANKARQQQLSPVDDGILYNYSQVAEIQTELDKLKSQRISRSCVPCSAIAGDCCGVLYWADDGRMLCNECKKEFDVSVTQPSGGGAESEKDKLNHS